MVGRVQSLPSRKLPEVRRSSTGWTPFITKCEEGAAAISLEPMPGAAISVGQRLDLSSMAPQSLAPLKADALPLMSLSPPPAGPGQQEASGSSQVTATFSEITPDIPTAPLKKQDFFHDHRLGIKVETPF
jgi:hypothetical protein